jgi:hypothetical protein
LAFCFFTMAEEPRNSTQLGVAGTVLLLLVAVRLPDSRLPS